MADRSTYLKDSFINSISAVISRLDELDPEFKSTLDTLSSKTNTFSFDNWNDEIRDKLETHVGDFKTSVNAVDADIRSGNFVILKSKLLDLYNEVDSLRSENDTYNRRVSDLNSAREDEDSTPGKISKIEDAVTSIERSMDNSVEIIEVLMTEISSIEFNTPFVELDKPIVVIEPVDIEDYSEEEEEEPVEQPAEQPAEQEEDVVDRAIALVEQTLDSEDFMNISGNALSTGHAYFQIDGVKYMLYFDGSKYSVYVPDYSEHNNFHWDVYGQPTNAINITEGFEIYGEQVARTETRNGETHYPDLEILITTAVMLQLDSQK